MKNYKENKVLIGCSEVARVSVLVLTEHCEKHFFNVEFGEDGRYNGYVVEQKEGKKLIEIPSHYEKVASFEDVLSFQFLDDEVFTYNNQIYKDRNKAVTLNIYRAGAFGCIVETVEK